MSQILAKPALSVRAVAMNEQSRLEIDLSRLDRNLQRWRRLVRSDEASPVGVCGVVKANAYGLGSVPIARCLADAGADMLAVYSVSQAEELLLSADGPPSCPLLVLMPTRQLNDAPSIHHAAEKQLLHLAVNDQDQLMLAQHLGEHLNTTIPIHLHLDTGMSRAGVPRQEFDRLLDRLPTLSHIRLAGVYSHLATADSDPAFAYAQLDRLNRALAENRHRIGPDVIVHTAATFAACRDRKFHHQMVRIGLGLHGYGPDQISDAPMLYWPEKLEPTVRWLANVVHVQRYPAGASVSYGCTYRLARPSLLGVVPVGYAEGLPVSLSNKWSIQVLMPDGSAIAAPVLGIISMDQIVIDLTDIPAHAAVAGATVELVSRDPKSPCALPRLAKAAGMSCYEMLCRISLRVPRVYVHDSLPSATVEVRS